jgi:GNAT superfamily N-acetyltransferase
VSDLEIVELAIPSALDAPGGAEFAEMTGVRNDIEEAVVGSRVLAFDASELLPLWQDVHEPKRLLVARVEGHIVARAMYEYTTETDDPVGWVQVEVLDTFRRHGIGQALYDALVTLARADGKTVLQSAFLGRVDVPGPRIESPTGFGSVPADDDGARFALRHGFQLEQVYRASKVDLPTDPRLLAELRNTAELAAGTDYRVLAWEGRTPDDRMDDIALLHTRMSTDAPSAELDIVEEVWTAERVRNHDDLDESSPRLRLTSAVEHRPSGRLVGYTELSIPPETVRPVVQFDTLVLSEHRGHRLGMLLKVANIQELEARHAGHPVITTTNAEENRHMLSVNEAVGFVAFGYEGAWKRAMP